MNTTNRNLFIFYYILAILAILCNISVVCYMLYFRYFKNVPKDTSSTTDKSFTRVKAFLHNPFYFAIFMLHLSNIGEEITLIPWIYKGNTGLCLFIESIKFYFTLMNCFSWFFLIQVYRILLFTGVENGKHQEAIATVNIFSKNFRFNSNFRWIVYFVFFVFPLICFIPFTAGSYRPSSSPWCTVRISSHFYLGFFLEYFWIWTALAACVLTNFFIFLKILVLKSSERMYLFFRNAGIYSIVALIVWIPRSIFSFYGVYSISTTHFIEYMPAYFAGIIFCILFYINREAIFYYEDIEFSGDEELEIKISDLFHIVDDLEPFNALFRGTVSFFQPKKQNTNLDAFIYDGSFIDDKRTKKLAAIPSIQSHKNREDPEDSIFEMSSTSSSLHLSQTSNPLRVKK